MKPFNLEKALAGESVVTRHGMQATQITLFKCNSQQPLVAVVNGNILYYDCDGRYMTREHDLDLFMGPVKKEGWVNIYRGGSAVGSYSRKENADYHAGDRRVACIKIEWEE